MSIKTALDGIKPDDKLLIDTERMLRIRLGEGKRKKSFHMNRLAFAACLVFVMGTLSISAYAFYQTPVSYVSLDINPSVELGVNRFDRVVTVEPYTEETKSLLAGKKLYGQKPQEAVASIIESAEKSGYVKKDGTTIVSIVTGGKGEARMDELLTECIKGINSGNKPVAVYSDTASENLRKEANSLTISAGKLKLIKMIQKLDSTVTVERFRNTSVTVLIEKLAYLTSAQYTGAPKEEKDSVHKDIQKVQAQLDQHGQKQDSLTDEEEKSSDKIEKKNSNGKNEPSKKDNTESGKPSDSQPKNTGKPVETPGNKITNQREQSEPIEHEVASGRYKNKAGQHSSGKKDNHSNTGSRPKGKEKAPSAKDQNK